MEQEINVLQESEEQEIAIIDENEEQDVGIGNEAITVHANNNYEALRNKPQINSVELIGNKTNDELNLQEKGNYANTRITNSELEEIFNW